MKIPRSAGILLHITALPSEFGIGDLGSQSYRFIDFLKNAGQKIWQILPLTPPASELSPYNCISAFAGNHMLVSPEKLKDMKLINKFSDVKFSSREVEVRKVYNYKEKMLDEAFENFKDRKDKKLNKEFNVFINKNDFWLEDFCLFSVLRKKHKGFSWNSWEKPLRNRDKKYLKKVKTENRSLILKEKFVQWIFFKQYFELKKYANNKGIKIIGDVPIYVSYDSADVWVNKDYFYIDEKGKPIYISGVPPDCFSEKGQLWGNPIYNWNKMKRNGYIWWKKRIAWAFKLYDFVRLDHFIGFVNYWQIKHGRNNAVRGKWVKGPAYSFFEELKKEFKELNFIAEDLGIVTDEVEKLRDYYGFPGMKILQFFELNKDYLPHNYKNINCVVYTGTHDNDTIIGWIKTASPETRKKVKEYLGSDLKDINWKFIRLAYSSVADVVIIPLQDILGVGSEARFNNPADHRNSWKWRFKWNDLKIYMVSRLKKFVEIYER